jgi:uncharacterized C2H2 Zn-finger protein
LILHSNEIGDEVGVIKSVKNIRYLTSDGAVLDKCPSCGREYDDIDFDYQICSHCKVDAEQFKPLEMTPMQISVYALNCPKEDKYFEEVANIIEHYADTKVYNQLEAPAVEFENKVLKTLKSMILSMAAHPDCIKGSEFFDLVSIAEKVLEGTLDTRHG